MASFGFSTAPAPSAVPASATPASAPASAAPYRKGVASPAVSPAPPPYAKVLEKARRDGAVSDAFSAAIRNRFGAPMEVKTTETGAAPAPVQAVATAQQIGGQRQQATATQATFAKTTVSGFPGGTSAGVPPSASANASVSTLARTNEAQQQKQARLQQLQNTSDFLEVLQMCDSGFNNSEVPPADNPASTQWKESGVEQVQGLHAAVGAIAVPAASNLICFIKTCITKHVQATDGETTATTTGLFDDNRRSRTYKEPLLLAAQCLYILSRHFQLTASVVKEALELLDALYVLLKNALRQRMVPLANFSENADTCAINTLTWLCVFSIVNMAAVWKKLLSASGQLQLNELTRSNVAASIDAAVANLRKRLRETVQSAAGPTNFGGIGAGGAFSGHQSNGGGVLYSGARAAAAAAIMPAVYTWQVLVDSYLSILTLAQGCLLRAQGDEQGYDKALDAFLGERMTSSSSAAGGAAANASPASVAVHRGKAVKRMVELAPVPRTLTISVGILYIAPYEMMSYMFDEMLPLMRHLSELEVATHRYYVKQLEELPRISASATARSNAATFYGRGGYDLGLGRPLEGGSEADNGWLRRTSRVGVFGEIVGEPFTSEMAHLLESLAICLQHLAPDVLNPDLDSDCAATFFIFKNFVKHMRQVFLTQRSSDSSEGTGTTATSGGIAIASTSSIWENYTLKLMTKFLEVLAMIGRNPQYTQRVVVLLTDAQTECGEMQWQSLVSQALECAGFNSAVIGSSGGGGVFQGAVSPSALAAVAAQASSVSQNTAANGGGGGDSDEAHNGATVPGANGAPRAVHRQFTQLYARKCQRQFISSFFLLLRQLFTHPTLRPVVRDYVSLPLALTFLFAPQQNQMMLGSTLALISALITNASDAQLVWTFLEQRQLLQQSSTRTQKGSAAGANGNSSGTDASFHSYDRFVGARTTAGSAAPSSHEEALSLMGHCQYECTQGTYDITIGFLNLVTALFQFGQPSMSALGMYTTVTTFVAQDILRGVLKRMFAAEPVRHTVIALASAALRQALQVSFQDENGRTAVLPFASVMAINKAPTDVVGEVLKVILDACDASYELLSHQRAAVRQALRLVIAAVQTVQEQRLEMLLFDTRTTLNADLAVRVLRLCTYNDTLLSKLALQLLLLFPVDTANQAAHYWSGKTDANAAVLDYFADLLHPLSTVLVVVPAPPELAQLDYEPSEFAAGWSTPLLTETKSLLLDLLMRHAGVTEPSLTAWMCGFYEEGRAASWDRLRHRHSALDATQRRDSDGGEPKWWRATLLTSVVEGACSDEVERLHPALAVKCVKLLYLLRANRLYGAPVVRPFLESLCQTLFLRLQHFRAEDCTPVALSKYAYVLQLLALEACYTYRTAPDDLRLHQNTSIPSIAVEVLLSLLHPLGGATAVGEKGNMSGLDDAAVLASGAALDGGSSDDGYESFSSKNTASAALLSRDAAADITGWLPQALQVLPTFPENLPVVNGGRSHLVPCAADGVVQYNVASLYEAFQAAQTRAGKPPLTMAELRSRLRPFITANDCFFSYAAGVSFVEGWCQLVSVSCSVVQGLSMARLRGFASCILRGIDATTTLTAAAQEQVAARLAHCLSTVMAHLRQNALAQVQMQCASFVTKDAAGNTNSRSTAAGDNGALQHCSTHDANLTRCRPREVSEGLARYDNHKGSTGCGNPFATNAGEASNFYSQAQRSQLTHALLRRRQDERRAAGIAQETIVDVNGSAFSTNGNSSGSSNAANDVGANVVLLQPLVHATVQWGTCIATIRADLYMSLLCLSETPGVDLDDVVMWRVQKALLDLVCADICSGCSASAASVVGGGQRNENRRLASGIPSGSDVAGGGGASTAGTAAAAAGAISGALPTQAQHAVALLVSLLQASSHIRNAFCNPDAGSISGTGDDIGTWATRCSIALLQSVDAAVCGFFASTGCALGPLLWHLRSAFDVLSVISLGHASQVLHSDLLRACFAMHAWQYSAQVVIGYSQASFAFDQAPSRSIAEQNKEVLRRLLLGVVRWVNLLLASLGDATPLLYEVHKFIRDNRSLVDYIFIRPAAVSSMMPGSATLSASHVTLCAELSDTLRALSSSVLAADCRTLVDSMALPELLNMLSSDEVWQRGSINLYDFADADGGDGGDGGDGAATAVSGGGAAATAASLRFDSGRGTASGLGDARVLAAGAVTTISAAERGRDVVALTVRNLAHLLLNAEYGLRGKSDDLNGGAVADATPMLRQMPSKRHLVLQVVRHVARGLGETNRAVVCEFRLECYLYALHALVCLLHSFVLPLTPNGSNQQGPEEFLSYLADVPLAELVDVLTQAHEAVYQLREFNTDYRGGMRAKRLNAHVWAVNGDGAAPAAGAAAPITQTLSNGMQLSHAEGDGARRSPQVAATPKTGSAGSRADAFSIPSTPGLLPAPESHRRDGLDEVTGTRAAPHRSPGGKVAFTTAATAPSTRGGGPSAEIGHHHARNPDTTVVLNFDGRQSSTEEGDKLPPQSSLWDLMPSQAAGDDGSGLTRLYDSTQEMRNGGSDDAAAAPLQWTNVLSVENEVRQVKIAIANALRATKGAMAIVEKAK